MLLRVKDKDTKSKSISNLCSMWRNSLNIVGSSTVESINEVAMFFDYLEDFYIFMVRSTSRWELMTKKLNPGK